MRILVCGSRGWKDATPIKAIINGHMSMNGDVLTLIHGDARSGADAIADVVGRKLGARVVSVPANWERFGKAAGFIRNQKMLDEQKPEVVYAFRASGKSSGTDDMVSRAKKAGIPTYVVSSNEGE